MSFRIVYLNYTVVSETVAKFRKGTAIEEDWCEEIDRDYKGRK